MVPSRMVNTLALYIGREPRVDRMVVDLKITKMAASSSLSGISGQSGHGAINAVQLVGGFEELFKGNFLGETGRLSL